MSSVWSLCFLFVPMFLTGTTLCGLVGRKAEDGRRRGLNVVLWLRGMSLRRTGNEVDSLTDCGVGGGALVFWAVLI